MRTDADGEFWNVLVGAIIGGAVGGLFEIGSQLASNNGSFKDLEWGAVVNKTMTGAALGASTALGVTYLGQAIAGTAAYSAGSVATAFGASVGISATTGGVGYVTEKLIDKKRDEISASGIIGHSVVTGVEGAVSFGIGGMVGSMEPSIGKMGKVLKSKEWYSKFIISQEFSNSIKIPMDKLRKTLWR